MNTKFKKTLDDIISNYVCLKCYKKIDRFRDNYKYNSNLKDVYKIKPYYTYNNNLCLKHKPCDFEIDISYDAHFTINKLDIRYSFFRDKDTLVDVRIYQKIGTDNSICFDNNICYNRGWYEIESEKPFCMKQVNKYINNLIFI